MASFGRRDRSAPVALRGGLGIPAGACLLGFFGRFMPEKGFLVLLDALERVAAAGAEAPPHLLAVGSGDFLREYRAEVARRPRLAGRITFRDHLPSVAPQLPEIDLLVVPSLWEACPLLPMEAMCAGVPVLGSDCIGLREVLRGSPSRMVAAGDATELAAGIRRAMRAPWTEQARQYAPLACRRFDVRNAARDLTLLFDQFAG